MPQVLSPETVSALKLVLYPLAVFCSTILLQRGTAVLVELMKRLHEFLIVLNKASAVLFVSYLCILAYVKFF